MISDIKAQAHLIKYIGITLSVLFIIVILTSGLPTEFDFVTVILNSIELKSLTLEIAISHLVKAQVEAHTQV